MRLIRGSHIAVVCLAALAWSCGEENHVYRKGDIDPEMTPTMRTLRANTTISDSGYTRYRILAPTWLMFDEAKSPHWKFPDGMHMEQYDNAGNIKATIDCDSAVYFTAKQLWRLDGAVDINSTDGQRFLTQQLYWDRLKHETYSDSFIHIERPDRVIEGFGFKSNEQMTHYIVRRPSGIFPASQFTTANAAADAPVSPDTPYDPVAAAADDPTDAQRTDTAFNGVPTDTIFVSTAAAQRKERRAARDVLRRRTPFNRQQTDTATADSSAHRPALQPATPPSRL
ncbi:MAG: LPS export ABC transporter periplasmic protein LptC [Candidatus Amulumruptor sp.]|nr:LPS export ABC transporter periplasmic protein LptC [Candidatus Amulumruptor sp.]